MGHASILISGLIGGAILQLDRGLGPRAYVARSRQRMIIRFASDDRGVYRRNPTVDRDLMAALRHRGDDARRRESAVVREEARLERLRVLTEGRVVDDGPDRLAEPLESHALGGQLAAKPVTLDSVEIPFLLALIRDADQRHTMMQRGIDRSAATVRDHRRAVLREHETR